MRVYKYRVKFGYVYQDRAPSQREWKVQVKKWFLFIPYWRMIYNTPNKDYAIEYMADCTKQSKERAVVYYSTDYNLKQKNMIGSLAIYNETKETKEIK